MSLLALTLLVGRCFAKSDEDNRIINGEPISIESAPWAVKYGDYCGGVILHSRWAMTAAHCGAAESITYGATFTKDGKIMRVSKWYPHYKYTGTSHDYDFQLLELETEIRFDKYARPIRIGNCGSYSPGTQLTVVGWGVLEESSRNSSEKLMSVTVPILPESVCIQYYRYFINITNRMFCAADPEWNKDSCQGDSGGPATVKNKLVGLVSWGFGCARPNNPGVYANVVMMRKWIRNITKHSSDVIVTGSDGKKCLCTPLMRKWGNE